MGIIDFISRKKLYFLLGVSALLISFAPFPRSQPETRTVTIPIQADSFSFSPGIVRVNHGDEVVIELTSTNVVHGLYLDDYELSTTSDPGQTTRVRFIADKPGTFRFRCSVTCGALHPFMIGKLRVGVNDLVWRGTALAMLLGFFGIWRIRND
jgi:heme/copper-type cytochrome/quinol oxidase subunit 2